MAPRRFNTYRDADIIHDIQVGGLKRDRALHTLLKAHGGFIGNAKKKYFLSEEDAQYAFKEALMGLMNQVIKGAFKGEAKLSTYLFRIFHFKCVDQQKKILTHKENEITWEYAFPQLPDESANFLVRIFGKEELARGKKLLNQIGEKCKRLLILTGQDFTEEEIANQLGYSNKSSVKTTRNRCREKLKTIIGSINKQKG